MFNQFYKQQFALPDPNVFITLYNAITPITIQDIQNDLDVNGIGIRQVINLKQDSKHISFYLEPNTILKDKFVRTGLVGSKLNNNIKIFFDLGAFNSLSSNNFTLKQQLDLLYLPAITQMGGNFNIIRTFTNNSIGLIYLGNPNIDVIALDNSNAKYFKKNNSKSSELFLDDSVQTSIGGAEPNRVQVHNNTAASFTTYIPNRTNPPKTTDLNAINIGGTYIELGFTQPTHVNALKYALVFLNGFFQDLYDVNNVYVTGLAQQTEYEIKIILADKYFNLSDYSNSITATTIDTVALFQNAVAYYKLDETSGDAIDVINGYNISFLGNFVQGATGVINKAIKFIDGRGELPLSIYNDFDNDNYTVSFWFKTFDNSKVQIIISDFNGNDFTKRKLFAFINGSNQKLRFGFGDNGNNEFIDSTTTIANNTKYFIQLKYNINGQAVLRLNNVTESTYTFINAPQNQSQIWIGLRKDGGGTTKLPLDGIIDEMSFINGQTSASVDSDLYNNGNGTTI